MFCCRRCRRRFVAVAVVFNPLRWYSRNICNLLTSLHTTSIAATHKYTMNMIYTLQTIDAYYIHAFRVSVCLCMIYAIYTLQITRYKKHFCHPKNTFVRCRPNNKSFHTLFAFCARHESWATAVAQWRSKLVVSAPWRFRKKRVFGHFGQSRLIC